MVTYDPRDWLRALRLHHSDTFRKLFPLILGMGAYSAVIAYFELHFFNLEKDHRLSNVTMMHSLVGFAISMLLVFRTNTAYDRWWEGRKLWGQLVNTSRNTSVKLAAYLNHRHAENDRAFFARLIGMYAHELCAHLRRESTRLALDIAPHPEIPALDRDKHVPSQVVMLMQQRLQRLVAAGHLSGDQLLTLNGDLTAYLDICGACERIKNTPIPYSYTSFIKKFILLYCLTLPFGLSLLLGFLAVPAVMFIFYVLASLELIAEEIEDPFGYDDNDLPMEKLARMIATNTGEILA